MVSDVFKNSKRKKNFNKISNLIRASRVAKRVTLRHMTCVLLSFSSYTQEKHKSRNPEKIRPWDISNRRNEDRVCVRVQLLKNFTFEVSERYGYNKCPPVS